MAQNSVTLNEIIKSVRELTFDRFVIPAFAIKAMGEGYLLNVDKNFSPEGVDNPLLGRLTIEKEGHIEYEFKFNEYKTLEELMNALIEAGIIVAYTPYFRGTESSDILIQVNDRELSDNLTLFRRYFFSDEEIKSFIKWYYLKVLDIPNVELTDELIGKLIRPSEKHLTIWVSYHLVDKRRLYENASNAVGQSFTDGSDYVESASDGVGVTTSVQIGSVFSITEDPTRGFFYEDYNRVGSDNVWGDRYSFWYKLMLYLRGLLEEEFGDFSLRKDNVIPGYVSLQRELDFRSYYDSYPFTLSPLSRGILSKTP